MTAQQKAVPLLFHTQYGLGLDPIDDLIIVDLFAGGGGASTGLEMGLGRQVAIAVNHNPAAISMHAANHPHALHLETDVWGVDPDEACAGRRIGWFHASPDCRHHSQAAGGQPRKKEIRDLSWVVLKWAGKKKPLVISLENVKQITKWGTLVAKRCAVTGRVVRLDGSVAAPGEQVPRNEQFLIPDNGKLTGSPARRRKRRVKFARHGSPLSRTWQHFLDSLRALGYVVEYRVSRACDDGAPTTRERLYLIARCDGHPIEWPSPTHAAKPAKGQAPYRSAAECIDWSDLGESIFGRKRPLAEATNQRLATGIMSFVLNGDPFIVPQVGTAERYAPFLSEHANASRQRNMDVAGPLPTICAQVKGGHFSAVTSRLVPVGTADRSAAFMLQANGGYNAVPARSVAHPTSTITSTGSQQQLAAATLAHLRGNCDARSLRGPLHTISAGGNHHGVVTAWLERQFGNSIGQRVDRPAPTTTAGGGGKTSLVSSDLVVAGGLTPEQEQGALRVAAFLMRYHSTGGQWAVLDEPMTTVTTKDRLALVTVWLQGEPYVIVDICLRMLKPRELYNAQGFPPDYKIEVGHDGRAFTKTEQVHMCGNSVSPLPMKRLAEANDPWRPRLTARAAA